MRTTSKVAGVVLAATALCGLGAGAAFAASPTGAPTHTISAASAKLQPVVVSTAHGSDDKVGKPMYSRGFNVVNLSQHPMVLMAVGAPEGDDGQLDGPPPPIGSILQPGQTHHYEMTYLFAKNSDIRAMYLDAKPDGTPDYSKGEVFFDFLVNGTGGTGSSANTLDGADVVVAANDGTDTMLDPAGTTVNFTPAQQQAAAKTLEQLCQKTNLASCSLARPVTTPPATSSRRRCA